MPHSKLHVWQILFNMKKSILIIFLVSLIYSAFAGIKDGAMVSSGSNSDSKSPINDTISYKINTEERFDYYDSLVSFPAYDLYCDWDTVNTHVTKFDIESFENNTKQITLCDKSSCGYVHPYAGDVTSEFGPRKRLFHYGIDIRLAVGDAVGAAFDGKVRIARRSKTYGNVIVIRHSNGLETYYAHLSKIDVEVGQEVYAGQIIGLGGNTGHSTGSHLHFEVRYLGQPINPTEIISFTDHKLLSDTLCLSKNTFSYICEAKKAANKTYASSKGAKGKGSKNKLYVVKKGDTLYSIARRYNTTPKLLSQKNGMRASGVLKLGQRIRL